MEKKVIKFTRPSGPKKQDPEGATFVMEDLETGEREGCDDLATALFGPGVNKDEFQLKEITPEQ